MVCASVAGASGWTNLDERSGHPVQEALGELGRLGAAGFVDHAFGAVLEKNKTVRSCFSTQAVPA